MDGKTRPEITALESAKARIDRAITEYRDGFDVAARLDILQAQRLLDRAYSGDVA